MAFNPGRNIGRVSIRVVPDTKLFKRSLERELRKAAGDLHVRAKVVGVDMDKQKIKRDMERQINSIGLEGIEAKVKVIVDQAKVRKTKIRESLQRQFDQMENLRVNLVANLTSQDAFERQVENLIDRVERKGPVQLPVDADTFLASQQIRYTARPRIVELFVEVNKASAAKAATALAALTGARLAGSWLEDIADFAKELDKNLPSILAWTTGVTSGFAAIAAAVSGLVGIGEGLFSVTPALLVLPGLLINAIGSISALIVAWRNAGDELAPLGDGMRELGEIINGTYWDRARQPILDLVNGLMPQLRNAFRDLSEGVGDFTAAFADGFGEELANGRLESIFKGIADGWRVLGTGADGFAGAIVSLSQIAATYTPRLARWFVRQADTFDAWLKAIATDGRLTEWMEGAIDSMYDLWDVTTGIAGIFEGIWRAADLAGSGGLSGFADMMLEWERVTKTADFQKGLSAIFRGSYEAMSAFGDGIKAIGWLVADLDHAFEKFISSSGAFAGGLVEAIADSLNTVEVDLGLKEFSDGLLRSLDRIKPSLQPIADTFGRFLGLLGDLAAEMLPAAATVLAELMPSISSLIDAVRPVLKPLADSVTAIAKTLGPAIKDFVDEAGPLLGQVLLDVAKILEALSPVLSDLVRAATSLLTAVGYDPTLGRNQDAFEASGMAPDPKDYDNLFLYLEDYYKSGQEWLDSKPFAPKIDPNAVPLSKTTEQINLWYENVRGVYETKGSAAAKAYFGKFVEGMDDDVKTAVIEKLAAYGIDIENTGKSGGGGFSRGLTAGIDAGLPKLGESMRGIKRTVETSTAEAGSWITGRGGQTVDGFGVGARGKLGGIGSLFGGLGGTLRNRMGGASGWVSGKGSDTMRGFHSGADGRVWMIRGLFSSLRSVVSSAFGAGWGLLYNAGSAIMSGLLSGLRSAWAGVQNFVGGIAPWIAANKGPESYDRVLLEPAGQWIMSGLERGLERGFGRVKSRVSGMADEIRDEFGAGLGSDVGSGISASMTAARTAAATSPVKQKGEAYATDGTAPAGVNVTFVNPITRDLEQEAWEAAQIIGGARV